MAEQSKTVVLDKDSILTCESKHSVFNSLMQDLGLDEAAKRAKVSYQHARRLATIGNIRSLVRQEKAKIEAKMAERLKITRESLTKNYMTAFTMAEEQKSPTGMTQATMGIARLYGLDRQVIEQSEQQKQLSDSQSAEARRLADIRVREDMGHKPGQILYKGTGGPGRHDTDWMTDKSEKVPQKATGEPEHDDSEKAYAMDWTNNSQDKDNTGPDGSHRPEQADKEQDGQQATEG